MARIGMPFLAGLVGYAWGDWPLYADSSLRTLESELGAQSPLGLRDLAGLANASVVGTLKRRCATEIRRDRVSTLATLGFVVPEGYGVDDFLSSSEGVQSRGGHCGLAAISKVPTAGWA